jgi:hypothetical protein
MKTQEIDGKKYVATTQEDGSILLVPEAEPVRTPEAGDVWRNDASGSEYLLLEDGYKVVGGSTVVKMIIENNPWTHGNYTYLGKFSEVYVKISDVQKEIVQIGPSYTSFSTSDLRKLGIVA